MTKTKVGEQHGHVVELESVGQDLYVVFDNVRIAKRGRPGTPHAKKWISLSSECEVSDLIRSDGKMEIEVKFAGGAIFIPTGSKGVH